MSSSEGYILNAVQTPGPLLPVYRAVDRGAKTTEAISKETGISSGLSEILTGLQLLRMIGKEDGEYYTSEYQWDVHDEQLNFRLTALHNLSKETIDGTTRNSTVDEDMWGKQSVALLNYAYLLNRDVQYFENDDNALYSAIDDWFSEINYQPRSQQGVYDHNDPKFGNWTRLAQYLGLVHKIRGREHTVYLDRKLILASVDLATTDADLTVDGAPAIGMDDYLAWLRQNLLFVEPTAEGAIPGGIARVLFELVREDEIEFVEYGDAGAMGMDGVPAGEGIASEANTITLVQDEH